ncbi:hypothetical protein Scep_027317 [Stephania cephalantha]|uniref:Uncharacterized protein n=1 Tax=Stephania cephalantha TaxID=152367 RepID=A0AAP0EA44_9MAGN
MKFIQMSSMPIDENITLKKNLKFIQISSMPIDENITLKKNLKLKVKLPQPKSQVENITLKKKLKLIKVKRHERDLNLTKALNLSMKDRFPVHVKMGVECLKTCEGQLSPSKSLRAAMLKSRFADTILKAQQKTLSTTGDRVDPLKVKQEERERFEKKQRGEKAKIDAHVKAAKEEAALKLLRQRQAARLALEEMEKSADVYDSFAIMKDLEMMGVAKCIGHDRVLEGLGLYLKNEFSEDDDDDVEEGEIIC